ncbi:hypothetical protein FA95DRAFT_1613469 [Auriscalpium vulgare]|uniref:Uncharacterized protein n=1 Tax=Auriscalpium vulgare TaxID=40419 RepID=A0ACB8R331_9AGAM|nr:hypothetical protein FA95DRAFT_1613469 [Auriscalpium vulgare]
MPTVIGFNPEPAGFEYEPMSVPVSPAPSARPSLPSSETASALGRRPGSARPDADDEEESPSKKSRADSHPLSLAGGIFGIMGDMWRNVAAIIKEGLKRSQSATEVPSTVYTAQQNKYYDLYKTLTTFAPDLVSDIRSRSTGGSKEVARMIEKGRSRTRSSLVHTIKTAICDWHEFSDDGFRKIKAKRGFNCEESGRLLCPATLDWNDPAVKAGLRDRDPRFPAAENDLPVFLWEDERVNHASPNIGFLRSDILVKALRHILLGPSCADDTGAHDGHSGGTEKPRAGKNNIKHITPAAIAYTATLVHFALSSQTQMAAGGSGGNWPYEKFYRGLVAYIEGAMTPAERDGLLAWWDARVLSGIANDDESSDDETTNPSNMSMLQRMRAHVKQASQTPSSPAADTNTSAPVGTGADIPQY